jgi:D-arabinose 5-phosphate isomerase GutQ
MGWQRLYFLHPADRTHSTIGMIRRSDVLLAVSSGEDTDQILYLLPSVHNRIVHREQ